MPKSLLHCEGPHLCDASAMLIQAFCSLPVYAKRPCPTSGKGPAILYTSHQTGNHNIPIWCTLLLSPRPVRQATRSPSFAILPLPLVHSMYIHVP